MIAPINTTPQPRIPTPVLRISDVFISRKPSIAAYLDLWGFLSSPVGRHANDLFQRGLKLAAVQFEEACVALTSRPNGAAGITSALLELPRHDGFQIKTFCYTNYMSLVLAQLPRTGTWSDPRFLQLLPSSSSKPFCEAMLAELLRKPFCTKGSLVSDFRNLGVAEGNTILLHSSLSRLGWVNGGAETVIAALLEVLGDDGTLVVPTHTGDNSDPSEWRSPRAPRYLWQTIRDTMPAYDPRITRTRAMGVIAETLRTWPGAFRSAHPQTSFAAVGRVAEMITTGHSIDCRLGEHSPLARLEEVGARVLLLGTEFDTCTSFHLAEYRTCSRLEDNSFSAMIDGSRQWVTVKDTSLNDDCFTHIGKGFEENGQVMRGLVGSANCKLFSLGEAVLFACGWMRTHRNLDVQVTHQLSHAPRSRANM